MCRQECGVLSGSNVNPQYISDSHIESTQPEPGTSASVDISYTAEVNDKYYVYVAADYAEEIFIETPDNPEDIAVQADCGSILNIGEMKTGDKRWIRRRGTRRTA